MTTDEMVREIRAALLRGGLRGPDTRWCGRSPRPMHERARVTRSTCRAGRRRRLSALQGPACARRATLSGNEAKAETLRKALGVPSPAMAWMTFARR